MAQLYIYKGLNSLMDVLKTSLTMTSTLRKRFIWRYSSEGNGPTLWKSSRRLSTRILSHGRLVGHPCTICLASSPLRTFRRWRSCTRTSRWCCESFWRLMSGASSKTPARTAVRQSVPSVRTWLTRPATRRWSRQHWGLLSGQHRDRCCVSATSSTRFRAGAARATSSTSLTRCSPIMMLQLFILYLWISWRTPFGEISLNPLCASSGSRRCEIDSSLGP